MRRKRGEKGSGGGCGGGSDRKGGGSGREERRTGGRKGRVRKGRRDTFRNTKKTKKNYGTYRTSQNKIIIV